MDAKNIACSACYGSGYGVDQQACPCGCRPAPAIAQPAAGSVDKDSLDEALDGWVTPSGALYRKIVAWGAQQREAGKAEQTAFLKECMVLGQDEFNRKWLEQKERAEKAEAEYKIVCDKNDTLRKYCEAAQETEEKWQGKAEKAEARVKELEAEDLAMHRKLSAETLRADQGWACYEAANRAKNDLERERGHKQSIIDRLMLEYCPDEMTVEQMAEWASHQKCAE